MGPRLMLLALMLLVLAKNLSKGDIPSVLTEGTDGIRGDGSIKPGLFSYWWWWL